MLRKKPVTVSLKFAVIVLFKGDNFFSFGYHIVYKVHSSIRDDLSFRLSFE